MAGTPRRHRIYWRLLYMVPLILLLAMQDAAAFQLFWIDDSGVHQEVTATNGNCPSPAQSHPVLFVHGHPLNQVIQPGPSYQRNWVDGMSFKAALDLAENQGLDIEDYYIEFLERNRSILIDANKIGEAIARIQACQDSVNPAGVKIAVIAYSKGTISTRLYLRSRQVASQGDDLSDEFQGDVPLSPHSPAFNPVSEFIALASPNHGLRLLSSSVAIRQLGNGRRPGPLCSAYPDPLAANFMSRLNGVANNNWSGVHETPASRANGDPVPDGTLFVSIYDNDDFVGGDQPDPSDCATPKRKQAFNRGLNAENIPINVADLDSQTTAGDIHVATVNHAEVICRALYTVAHHRVPPQTPLEVCDTIGGLPVIPDGTGVVLALDHSGSMGISACPGCGTKQAVLRDGIELFLSTWQPLSKPQDKAGITYFRTDTSQFTAAGSGDTLVPVQSDSAALVADLQTQAASSSGLTAMGAALQTSILELDGIDPPLRGIGPNRHVILFTDGLQNVNPKVHDDASQRLILETVPGLVDAGIPILLSTPLADEDIVIDTIGIGVNPTSEDLLEDLALETGGESHIAQDMAALDHFLTVTLVNALRDSSPQLVAYRYGTLANDEQEEVFAVNAGARQIVLRLSWPRGNDLSFRVVKDGADLTDAGTWIEGGFYRIFSLNLPASLAGGAVQPEGSWHMVIRGKAGTSYEAAAIVDEPELDYRVSLGEGNHLVGEPLALEVRLSAEGLPIEGAQVTARVERPTDSIGNLLVAYPMRTTPSGTAFEPATTLGQRAVMTAVQDEHIWRRLQPATDSVTLSPGEPGVYRASFTETTVPGIYIVSFEIEVRDRQGGTLRRSHSISTPVGVGAAEFESSGVTLQRLAETDRGREVALRLTPRDRFGNYFGPDQGDTIGLKAAAGTTVGSLQDFGNGTYAVPLILPLEGDPRVTLTIAGAELFSAPVSELEPPVQYTRLLFWILLALGWGLALVLMVRWLVLRRSP